MELRVSKESTIATENDISIIVYIANKGRFYEGDVVEVRFVPSRKKHYYIDVR